MATQLENLGLKTWAPSDMVNLSEINGNFELLDRSVTQMTLLRQATTAACAMVELDLSDIDLTRFRELILHLESPGDLSNSDPALIFNDDRSARYKNSYGSSTYTYHRFLSSTNQYPWSARISIMPLGSGELVSKWFSMRAYDNSGQEYDGVYLSCGFQGLQKITYFDSKATGSTLSVPVGTTVNVVGVL